MNNLQNYMFWSFPHVKSVIEREYDVKLTNTGDLYNVYTLDGKLIFITSNIENVLSGLRLLYSKGVIK